MNLEQKALYKFTESRLINGELFLPIIIGIQFIEFCEEQDVALIGLEFFYVNNTLVQPVNPVRGMDCSEFIDGYDSWPRAVSACANLARKVFQDELAININEYFCPTVVRRQGEPLA